MSNDFSISNLSMSDMGEIHQIWHDGLGSASAISADKLSGLLNKKSLLGFYEGDKLAGFIAYSDNNNLMSVTAIVIMTTCQRKGIGTALLNAAIKSADCSEIRLGSGAGAYFWPGVPSNLPSAISFFRKNGFSFYEESFDLVMDLKSLKPAATPDNIMMRKASSELQESILRFEEQHFLEWEEYFEQALSEGNFSNVLTAQGSDGTIIGSALIFGPALHTWLQLGNHAGGLGALGVHPDYRERGIGLALASWASEELKKRGVEKSFVGWTWLVEWYGQLGYNVFQKYQMGKLVK